MDARDITLTYDEAGESYTFVVFDQPDGNSLVSMECVCDDATLLVSMLRFGERDGVDLYVVHVVIHDSDRNSVVFAAYVGEPCTTLDPSWNENLAYGAEIACCTYRSGILRMAADQARGVPERMVELDIETTEGTSSSKVGKYDLN